MLKINGGVSVVIWIASLSSKSLQSFLNRVCFLLYFKIADERFNQLEEKFHNVEKLIKSFIKDSIQNISSLKVNLAFANNKSQMSIIFLLQTNGFEPKEFLKAQTMCAESLQEFYCEDQNNEISTYVHINANVLNEIFSKNVIFFQ